MIYLWELSPSDKGEEIYYILILREPDAESKSVSNVPGQPSTDTDETGIQKTKVNVSNAGMVSQGEFVTLINFRPRHLWLQGVK